MKSPVWGNQDFPITQGFGVRLGGKYDQWYAYAADWNYPAGTHIALDIGMPRGTKLHAPVAAKVVRAGENLEFNRPGEVVLEYKIGESTEHLIYAHMWTINVRTGDTVKPGQYLGTSGEQTVRGTRTPDGSGPHLHIERRDITRQTALDPTPILTGSDAVAYGSDTGNWPTAEKINSWISQAGNKRSPLRGMGDDFIAYGKQYGINPGIVVAIMQRESQMGADDSVLPNQIHNYAGITDTPGNGFYFIDRYWKVFKNPKDGLHGVFQLLDTDLYRDTGGRLEDIMKLYAPEWDSNEWGPMFNTFRIVGEHLGITINRDTNIYGGESYASGAVSDVSGIVDMIGSQGPRIGTAILGIVVLAVGVALVFGDSTPVGRVAKTVGNMVK